MLLGLLTRAASSVKRARDAPDAAVLEGVAMGVLGAGEAVDVGVEVGGPGGSPTGVWTIVPVAPGVTADAKIGLAPGRPPRLLSRTPKTPRSRSDAMRALRRAAWGSRRCRRHSSTGRWEAEAS